MSQPATRGAPGWRRRRYRRVTGDRRDELEPALRDRLNEPGVIGAVTERRSNLREAVSQAAIEINVRFAAPHRVADLFALVERMIAFLEPDAIQVRRLPLRGQLLPDGVADGTGGHVFAETLEEQTANVKRWYAIRRQRGEM